MGRGWGGNVVGAEGSLERGPRIVETGAGESTREHASGWWRGTRPG